MKDADASVDSVAVGSPCARASGKLSDRAGPWHYVVFNYDNLFALSPYVSHEVVIAIWAMTHAYVLCNDALRCQYLFRDRVSIRSAGDDHIDLGGIVHMESPRG